SSPRRRPRPPRHRSARTAAPRGARRKSQGPSWRPWRRSVPASCGAATAPAGEASLRGALRGARRTQVAQEHPGDPEVVVGHVEDKVRDPLRLQSPEAHPDAPYHGRQGKGKEQDRAADPPRGDHSPQSLAIGDPWRPGEREALLEPVLDQRSLGYPDAPSGGVEPPAEIDVLARDEPVVEVVVEQGVSIEDRRDQPEPVAAAARPMVKGERAAPVV